MGTDDGYDTAISFVVEEGRISRIYAVRNPAKKIWHALKRF